MKSLRKRIFIKGFLFCIVIFLIMTWIPQNAKIEAFECCKWVSTSPGPWTACYETECPESPGDYCDIKFRNVNVILDDCDDEWCLPIRYDCRPGTSYAYVYRQFPDCTGMVTSRYKEWQICEPCIGEEECFDGCDPGENPLEELAEGDCP